MSKVDRLPDRALLSRVFSDPAVILAFEQQSQSVEATSEQAAETQQVAETQQTSPVLTWAASSIFTNERILTGGPGVQLKNDGTNVAISLSAVPDIEGGHKVTFLVSAPTALYLPPSGVVSTIAGIETLSNKVLDRPKVAVWGNYMNDAAAAAAGVPIGGIYRNGSQLMIRTA